MIINLCRSLHEDCFGQTALQLSISLFLYDVISLIGFNRFQIGSDIGCIIISAFTHYLLLTSLTWVAAMGYVILTMVSPDYITPGTGCLVKRAIVGWGLPLLPVGLALGFDMAGYGRHRERLNILPILYLLYSSISSGVKAPFPLQKKKGNHKLRAQI